MNKLIKIDAGMPVIAQKTVDTALKLNEEYKRLDQKIKAFKAALKDEMEAHGIYKLENEQLSITYIAETDRETFDTKAFKKADPDTYDQYVKLTPVKSSIRIKEKAERGINYGRQ